MSRLTRKQRPMLRVIHTTAPRARRSAKRQAAAAAPLSRQPRRSPRDQGAGCAFGCGPRPRGARSPPP